MKKYLHDKIHDIGSHLEFQINSREIVGVVCEVNFEKDKHQTRLWYVVEDESGVEHKVDGELFQIIK